MSLHVHAADVFFTQSRSVLGRLIRWAETDPGEEPTWANHVGVVVKSGWLVPEREGLTGPLAETVEALWHVEHTRWWRRHGGEKDSIVAVWRHSGLTDAEAIRVCDYAMKHVGDRYGWWKLGFHLLDRVLFRGDKKLSRLLRIDGRPICSYLVARGFEIVGVEFGMPAVTATPDEMMDHCVAHDQWKFIGSEVL